VPAKRFSYEPEKISDDLYAIPLPLHDGSPVNAYVGIGEHGVYLIDGGLGTEQCQAILRQGLESLGYGMADVQGIVITHGHTDHIGAAQSVADQGGEVLAHRVETSDGRRLAFDPGWLERNGLPVERSADGRWRESDWPLPTRLLDDGERVRWGTLDLQVVWCPGHTRGLVCLYEPTRRWLFTTDHVMRRAPAPVTLRDSLRDDDPLGDYLASVRKLDRLDVHTVLPGHGRPFGGLHQRLAHIQAEIQQQLDHIRARLTHGPASGYELLAIEALRDRRPMAERYNLSLVLARLRHLERLGDVVRSDDGERIRYELRNVRDSVQ
jgi:glyoxylase-like metal-dependent hydrolase (beta-lactamase superfamily II)